MTSLLARLRAGAALALMAGLCAAAVPTSAEAPETVRVGVGPGSLTYTSFFLAERLGFFKSENLNVQWVPIDSAALMVAPLGVGQLDVGGGAISAGLYNAVARNIDIRIVADLGSDPPNYGFQQLVVRKSLVASGGFKNLSDLKGKTIAITARAISTTALVAALLKKANLTLGDVKLVYLTQADQLSAFGSGSIDAALMPEPGPSLAVKAGVGVRMLHDDAFYPNQELVVMLYGSGLLHDHRDVGLRFMRAFLKAARLYNDNLKGGRISGPQADEIMSIYAEQTHQDRSVLSAVTPPGVDPNGHLNLASMRDDYNFFKEQGLLDGAGSGPESAVDASFAADAVKAMGPYKR